MSLYNLDKEVIDKNRFSKRGCLYGSDQSRASENSEVSLSKKGQVTEETTVATPTVVVEQTLVELSPLAEPVLNCLEGEAIGISYVVNLFNPDTVILGGLSRNVGADFVATQSRVVERHVIPNVFHRSAANHNYGYVRRNFGSSRRSCR